MKRSRFSEQQIIAVLKEREAGMANAAALKIRSANNAISARILLKPSFLRLQICPLMRHDQAGQGDRSAILLGGAIQVRT